MIFILIAVIYTSLVRRRGGRQAVVVGVCLPSGEDLLTQV